MEELPVNPPSPVTPKRPTLLTALCFLTFLGSGLNLMSSLVIVLLFAQFKAVIENTKQLFNLPGIDILLNARPAFFFFNAVFYALSLGGAILMWRLKKAGFHLYTVAQILLIISPMYFLKIPGPLITDLVLSGIFIILYGLHLKIMS
jgi:hypothetical protein